MRLGQPLQDIATVHGAHHTLTFFIFPVILKLLV